MDLRTFGRLFLGRQPGYRPSPEEFEADKKAYEYYIKKSIDNRFDPEILNTQQGMYARYDGTNAVAIAPMTTNAQGQVVRGEPLRGYAADPYAAEAGAPAPLAGGGMMATNAPTAAPVQTPAPSPTPFPEGAVIRSKRDGQNYRIVNGQPVLVGP
jgi:hypothetical protein